MHSFQLDAPDDGRGPKKIKLFVNMSSPSFEDVESHNNATYEKELGSHAPCPHGVTHPTRTRSRERRAAPSHPEQGFRFVRGGSGLELARVVVSETPGLGPIPQGLSTETSTPEGRPPAHEAMVRNNYMSVF